MPNLPTDDLPPFPVFLAYHDTSAARQALGLLRNLAEGLNDSVDFDLRLWRLDVLGDARARALAEDDLRDSGLLVISAGERARLPAEVMEWIRQILLGAKSRHLAAVVLWSRPSCLPGEATRVEVRWAADFAERLIDPENSDTGGGTERSRHERRAP